MKNTTLVQSGLKKKQKEKIAGLRDCVNLLAVYRVQDEAGAREAAEKLIAAGVDAEKVKTAMDKVII